MSRLYRLVALLFLLAVSTSILASVPFARYASTGDEVSDTAKVAGFATFIEESGSNGATYDEKLSHCFFLNPGSTEQKFEFIVINAAEGDNENVINCDVAMNFDVILTLPEKIPGVDVELKTDAVETEDEYTEPDTTIPYTLSEDGLTYTFSNVGTFPPNTLMGFDSVLYFRFDEPNAQAGVWEGIKVETKCRQVD